MLNTLTTASSRPEPAGLDLVVPPDITGWVDSSTMPTLALRATEAIDGVPSRWWGSAPRGEGLSGPMLLTLLTYCYSRGVLTTPEIEVFAGTDPVAIYLCGGQRPGVAMLLSFRRQHREQLQSSLACCFGLAWQQWAWSSRALWRASARCADFRSEAIRRIDRAVRLDSMLLDD
jgi:hypothetical protein